MASDLSPEDKPELGDDQPHEVLFYLKALLTIWSCKCLFLFFIPGMKEGNVLFNDALNTFFNQAYGKVPLI